MVREAQLPMSSSHQVDLLCLYLKLYYLSIWLKKEDNIVVEADVSYNRSTFKLEIKSKRSDRKKSSGVTGFVDIIRRFPVCLH